MMKRMRTHQARSKRMKVECLKMPLFIFVNKQTLASLLSVVV